MTRSGLPSVIDALYIGYLGREKVHELSRLYHALAYKIVVRANDLLTTDQVKLYFVYGIIDRAKILFCNVHAHC